MTDPTQGQNMDEWRVIREMIREAATTCTPLTLPVEDASRLHYELSRHEDKMRDVTDGMTVLFMSDEDRAKDVLDLDDQSMAAWARWAVSKTRAVMAEKADKDGTTTEAIMALHGVITLALIALEANAGRLTYEVGGVTYRGEDKGDWRFVIERSTGPGYTPGALLLLGYTAAGINGGDGFKVTEVDKDEGTLIVRDVDGVPYRVSVVQIDQPAEPE